MSGHESPLYCSAEYHLVLLNSATAIGIYNLALRLSQKTGRFRTSIRTLADYFKRGRTTIIEALQLLEGNGWFERLSAEPGKPVVYRPIYHSDWAETRSSECVEKLEYPWSAEDHDELGRMLYAHSDGRFKIYPNILKGLRSTGHTNGAIQWHFTQFWSSDSKKKKMWGRFKQYLEAQPVQKEAAA